MTDDQFSKYDVAELILKHCSRGTSEHLSYKNMQPAEGLQASGLLAGASPT